jgi:uncharacterized protein YndB with AHSA1/START domain
MTTPNVPLRMERTLEVPGTPEQVWDAIATANGITSWFLPTDLEERAGGAVTFHMGEGEGESSTGEVTGWEPPGRLVYEEPHWAALVGHEGAPVTPLVTEFLVDAQSGGSCVVKIVTSAFGVGADWEQEFFDDMTKHWVPFFDNLRLYLTHFPGQQVTSMTVNVDLPGPVDAAWAALKHALGATKVGDTIEVRGERMSVERIGTEVNELLVRTGGDLPGFLLFSVFEPGNGSSRVAITGYLFSETAPALVDGEKTAWKEWLDTIATRAS